MKTSLRKNRTYKKNDFVSGDGMLTSVWGPSMWHFLHTMSFNYPVTPTPADKKHYRDFMLSLQYTLPCKYCRMNLVKNYKKMPITMSEMANRDTFSRYVYNLHELINKMLKKTSHLSYCDVRERYENFRSRCTADPVTMKVEPIIQAHSKVDSKQKKEKGCTEPLYGKKSKCIIKIVPQSERGATFQMNKKCVKTRKLHAKH